MEAQIIYFPYRETLYSMTKPEYKKYLEWVIASGKEDDKMMFMKKFGAKYVGESNSALQPGNIAKIVRTSMIGLSVATAKSELDRL